MGQASPVMFGRGTVAGQPRFRVSDRMPSLDDPIQQVAAAVREVLAEFRGRMRDRVRTRGEPDCQVVMGKLFSARHAESLLPGTRTVQMAPGTVVTPVARDVLTRLGITIRLASSYSLMAAARGEWAFAIDVEAGTTQALRRALLDDPFPWAELEPSLESVIAWLLEASGRGAMFITSDAAVAVWRSCQVPGVRAASATEPTDVGRSVASLGVNLLVVESAGKSISWMKQLGTAFRRSGAPAAPRSLEAGGRR